MRKAIAAVLIAAGWICLVATEASAQNYGGGSRGRTSGPSMRRSTKPTTSPYLNLLNRNNNNSGGGVGFNYFQRVKPEQEFRSNDNQLRQSINSVQQQVNVNRQMILKQSNASQLTQ